MDRIDARCDGTRQLELGLEGFEEDTEGKTQTNQDSSDDKRNANYNPAVEYTTFFLVGLYDMRRLQVKLPE